VIVPIRGDQNGRQKAADASKEGQWARVMQYRQNPRTDGNQHQKHEGRFGREKRVQAKG
jgi:hypothetical protein